MIRALKQETIQTLSLSLQMLTRKSGPSKLTEKSKTSEFHSITFSLSFPSGVLYGGLFDHPDYLIYFLCNKVVFD